MDQMQSSCLYMMQMVTAQKTDPGRGKSDAPEKDDFRKLLEQCGEQKNEPAAGPAAEKAAETEQKPEQTTVNHSGVPVAEDPMLLPEGEDEDVALMQELAAMQMLYADQRIVTETPAEAIPTAAAEAVNAAETVEPISNGTENGLPVAEGNPETRSAEEVLQKPVETAQNPAGTRNGPETGLQEQGGKVQTSERAVTDGPEMPDLTEGAEMPVFDSVEAAPIKVSETAAPVETAPAEPVENQIADKLSETLAHGETRVEIQLTPEHLGKVTVQLTQKEDGSLHIALQAESSQTRSLLERDLSGLQSLLSRTTQQEVQVNVSQPQEQQQQQNYDGHQQQQQQQQQQQERRSTEDFLNQLRLGLLIPEAEAS